MPTHLNCGTVVNCLDGEVQESVISFLKSAWNVEWVDVITEAAPERILGDGRDTETIRRIHKNIEESLRPQAIRRLAIAAHSRCDINTDPDETKIATVRKVVVSLRRKYRDVDVVGVWVDPSGVARNAEA